MTSGQKIAFSLLAALALFAVFVMSLNSRLFNELETRFYAQAKIEENTGQLDKISESCDSYISEILSLVEKGENAWVKNASVRSYYVQNPSESDVNVRRRLTESLFTDISALKGIRIVDKNGRNVHYSSFDDTDLLKQSGITKVYKNYNDIIKDAGEIPFETLQKITSETKAVLLCDESRGRLILSVPFCWVDGIYSGIALFYLNMHEIEKTLISREVISLGQSLTLYSDDDYNGGLLLNLPHGKKNDFRQPVLNYWKNRSAQPEKLLAIPDGRFYLGLTSNRIGKIRVSAVYTSDIFELSTELRVLIYICIFISILLIVFLIFSFFRDPMITLKKRIKKIQLEIIENYIDGKEKREWNEVARHLRVRRNDLSDEIINSLHVHSKKRRKELADYLDKNWDEIFAIFETKTGESSSGQSGAVNQGSAGAAELTGASIAEIRHMLEEVLANRNLVAPVAAGAAVGAAAAVTAVRKAAPVPANDEVDELDEVEEIEEIEDADELDEVEEIDEADEIEDLAEEADDADEIEDLAEDADDAEEVLDEVEEIEEAEEAEEAEGADEVEELVEEADEAEQADDADEVEELSEEAGEEEVEELAEEVEPEAEEKSAEETEETEEEVEDLDEEIDELDEAVDELDEAVDELDEEVEELEGDEELEVLESAEDEIDALIKSMAPPSKNYIPSNETYFVTEKFATVENLYAEELKLGNYSPYYKKGAATIDIKIYPLPVYESDEAGTVEPNVAENQPEETIEDAVVEEPQIEEAEVEEAAEPEVEDVAEVVEAEVVEDAAEVDDTEDDYIEDDIIDEPLMQEAAPVEEVEELPVEELTEEVPDYLPEPDFSMTSFGENLSEDVPELQEEKVIVEQDDGVFSIVEDLKYTDVIQDADFKNLVDSVL